MSDTATRLAELPLFFGIGAEEMGPLTDRLVERSLDAGEILFEANTPADHLHFLMEGQVDLLESGSVKVSVRPVAPIGELGAMTTGVTRNTTALAATPAKVLTVARMDLMEAIHTEPGFGVRLQQNLLDIVSDKIGRDGRRITQMRSNLVRTQKEMKRLREELLSQPTTPLSETFHAALEGLIQANRRAHYSVVPPAAYPAKVRTNGTGDARVLEIARTRLRVPEAQLHADGDVFSGALVLPQGEIPVSGTVVTRHAGVAEVDLDLLIEEYASTLEDYLTRAQMLDLVV